MEDTARKAPAAAEEPIAEKHQGQTESQGALGPERPGADVGPRAVLTVEVDDVDAKCAELQELGVSLLNGPMDRPWGVRTASFRDPAGHIWEIGA